MVQLDKEMQNSAFEEGKEALDQRVLLLCNRMSWSDIAFEFVKTIFKEVEPIFWNIGEPYPSRIDLWEGDWILSFRGDLILPSKILNKASRGAINFHPAPPKYRGIGSHHYAIYNRDEFFGATCHHMTERIDQGEIIKVVYFTIPKCETASSLALRAGAYCLTLFYDIISEYILKGVAFPKANEVWGEELYTYKKLNEWMSKIKSEDTNHLCLK
jgi:methionyl-tRNA formyltransferase